MGGGGGVKFDSYAVFDMSRSNFNPPTIARNNYFLLQEKFCLKFKPIFRLYLIVK